MMWKRQIKIWTSITWTTGHATKRGTTVFCWFELCRTKLLTLWGVKGAEDALSSVLKGTSKQHCSFSVQLWSEKRKRVLLDIFQKDSKRQIFETTFWQRLLQTQILIFSLCKNSLHFKLEFHSAATENP